MELQDGEDFPKGNTKHNESDVLLYNKLTSELPDLKIAPVKNADEIDDNNFNFLQYKKAKSNFADMPDVALPTDITPEHMAAVAKASSNSYFNSLLDNAKDDKDVKKRGFKKLTYTDVINPDDESYLEQKNADIISEKATKLGKSVGIDYMEAIPTAGTQQKNPLAYTNYGQLNQINERLTEKANNKNLAIVNSKIKKINASLPKEERMQELTSFKEYESQEPIIKEKAKRADLLNTKKSNDIFLKGVNEAAKKSGIRQFVDIADYNKNYEPETLKNINKEAKKNGTREYTSIEDYNKNFEKETLKSINDKAKKNGTREYTSLEEYNKSVSVKIVPKKIVYSREEQKKQIVKAGKASGTIPKWVSEKDAVKMLSKYEGNFTSTQVGAIAETARTFNENITKKEAARKLTKPVPSLSETLQFGFASVNPINIKAPIPPPPDQRIAPKRVYSEEDVNMAFLESGRLSGVIPKGLSNKDALKLIAEKRLQLDPKTKDIISEAVVTSKEKRKEIATASHEEILNNAAFRTQELLSADTPTQNLYKQSREGKVADIINRIQSGLQGEVGNETVSEAEWKYLKEVAPKAAESLWKEINPNNSNKLSDVIAVYKDKEKAYKVTSANSRAKSIFAALPQDWLDENGQISEASLLEKHKEFNDNYAQSLIALEGKYPMQYAEIKTADGMQNRPIGRGYVYAAEKRELENRRAEVNNIIAEANGVMIVRQVDKKTGKQLSALLSPDAIGEKIFKVQSPDIYKVYVKGGKTDRGTKEEIKRLGINALYASNDKNAIELAYVDERKLNETSLDLEKETYNRMGAEIYKQSGWGKYIGTLMRDVDELDKIAEQLPYQNRKMWFGKLRAIEENKTFGTNIPVGGAINSALYGFGKTAASTVNTLSGAVGFRTDSDIANDALAGQDNKYSVVGETKEAQKIKAQLEYKLSNKEQLTYSELQNLENAKNLLGTKTFTSKFIDKGFELVGQVTFQAVVARGLGGLSAGALGEIGLLSEAGLISEEAAIVAGSGEFGTAMSGATTIGEIGVSKTTLDTLANAYVAYASSLDQAKQEAVLLMPDSKVKQEIYANVVGLLNAATAHIFPEQKLFDPFKKEMSATITNIVNDLSASKLSKEALSGYVKKALLASKSFGIAVIKNNQKESAEEVAGQIGTSIALAILAPNKFNNKEEFDKILDTYVQTTVDGTLLSLFAGGKEYFSNVVGIPLLSKVGTDENVYNKVIQGINSQVSNKEISEAEGEEKKYIANTIRYIYKKSIPKVAELSPNLKERDIQKYAIVLANEYVVRKKIDTESDPVIKAKLEAQVKDSEAKREAIIDEKLTTVNNYELVTIEEANKIAKAEADNGQIVITNADGTVTTTPTKTIDGVGTYEFDNKLYVQDKDGNITYENGVMAPIAEQEKVKKEGLFTPQTATTKIADINKELATLTIGANETKEEIDAKNARKVELQSELKTLEAEVITDAIAKKAAKNGTTVEFETKKADIEKRRKEELSTSDYKKQVGLNFSNGKYQISTFDGEEDSFSQDVELTKEEKNELSKIDADSKADGDSPSIAARKAELSEKIINRLGIYGVTATSPNIINAKYDKELATLETSVNPAAISALKEVEVLRTEEQKELDTKIENAEQYRVDGKVDRTKLTSDADRKAFDEVYAKYDKLIAPLLEKAKPKIKTKLEALPTGTRASDGEAARKVHAPLFSAAKRALKVLNQLFPSVDIHFHDNNEDFQEVLNVTAGGKPARTTQGNFTYSKDGKTIRIDINLASGATTETVVHEAAHAILFKAFGDTPRLFKYFKNQVARNIGFTKSAKLKKFIRNYEDIEKPEEYLVQLGAILKDGENIEPTVFRRIAEAINKIVFKYTGGKFKPFEDVKKSNDKVRYFASLVNAIKTGDLGSIDINSQSQFRRNQTGGSKQSRGGITATDMKSMTVADNGDLLFFHYGDIKGSKIDARKGTPKAYTTDKRVYTANYYYTNESDREGMVGGKVNVVRVPADKVYNFNKDVLGLFDEAKKNSEAHSKGQAFSPNRQADFIAQLAAKNGFDMVVAKWGNGYRAESPKALPIDAALTKQMRTNGSLSTAAVDDKLNQDIYNAAASKANGNSEKYRSAFYGIKNITAKDIMEHPILSRGIPKKLADKYNGGQIRSKQSLKAGDKVKIEGVSVTIPSEVQQDLLKQERTAKSYFDEKVRLMEPSPLSKEEIKSILNRDDIAILTGTNPDGNAVADNTNNLLNKKAEDWLKRNGYTYHQVTGKYGQTESSFLVEGMTGNVALEFAKIFKQDSVLQSEGLIYREGTIEKRIADGDAFGLDVTEPEADYVSAIKTNTGEVVGFQFGLDLGNKVQYEVKSKQSKTEDALKINSIEDTYGKYHVAPESGHTKIDVTGSEPIKKGETFGTVTYSNKEEGDVVVDSFSINDIDKLSKSSSGFITTAINLGRGFIYSKPSPKEITEQLFGKGKKYKTLSDENKAKVDKERAKQTTKFNLPWSNKKAGKTLFNYVERYRDKRPSENKIADELFKKGIVKGVKYKELSVDDKAKVRAERNEQSKSIKVEPKPSDYYDVVKKKSKDIINSFKEEVKNNLRALYNNVSEDFKETSRQWYDGANRLAQGISESYGISLEQSAGILAALSPKNNWFNNISAAERVIRAWADHQDTTVTKEMVARTIAYMERNGDAPFAKDIRAVFSDTKGKPISELVEEYKKTGNAKVLTQIGITMRIIDQSEYSPVVYSVSPEGFIDGKYGVIGWSGGAALSNAVSMLIDPSMENISSRLGNGNKVRNFYGNIADPQNPDFLTADTHAFAAGLMLPASANDAQEFGIFDGGMSVEYAIFKDAYTEIAKEFGILPRELQSITWEAVRGSINTDNRTPSMVNEINRISEEFLTNGKSNENRTNGILKKYPINFSRGEWSNKRGIEAQKGISGTDGGVSQKADTGGSPSVLGDLRGQNAQVGSRTATVGSNEIKSKQSRTEDAKSAYEAKLEENLEQLRDAYGNARKADTGVRKIKEDSPTSVGNFIKRLINGATPEAAAEAKAKLVEMQRKYRKEKAEMRAMLPRERGVNFVIEKISRAARNGDITQDEADLAIDLLRKSPSLFGDLAISITSGNKKANGDGVQGWYRAADELVKIFKNPKDPLTVTHELLHHTERFLPQEVRDGIIKEWHAQVQRQAADIASKLKTETDTDTRQQLTQALLYLGLAEARQLEPDFFNAMAMENIMKKYLSDHTDSKGNFNKGLGDSWYQLYNPSEWWAVNASKIFRDAKNKPELKTWADKAKAFYNYLIDSIKKVFKGNPIANVEKGLKAILEGNTLENMEGNMLANSKQSLNIKQKESFEQRNFQAEEGQQIFSKQSKISSTEATKLNDEINLNINNINNGKLTNKEAVKNILDLITGLLNDNKISEKSANSLKKRFKDINAAYKNSVDRLLEYANKIFKDGKYADKISEIKSLNRAFKKAAKNDKIPVKTRQLASLFAKINPESISDINAHLDMAKNIEKAIKQSKRENAEVKLRTPIKLDNAFKYVEAATKEAKDYEAKNPPLIKVVNSFNDEEKALQYISDKYKEFQDAIKNIISNVVLTDAEMAQLKNFLKLSIDDFETMEEKTSAVEALEHFATNEDMGKIPFLLNNQQVNANIKKGVEVILPKLKSVSLMWFSEQKAKIRGWVYNKFLYGNTIDYNKELAYFMNQSIRRIDNLIGNLKTYEVFDNTFKAMASGYSKYIFKIKSMDADVIFQKVLSSFNGDMEQAVKHCYKMTMYKLQLEYESNIGNIEVIPAIKHLNETLKSGNLTKKDKAELRKLIDEFSTIDATTGEQNIDTTKIWDSFNEVEQQAAVSLAEHYAKLTPYAQHVAVSLRNVPFNPRANYMMLNVVSTSQSLSALPPSASQVLTGRGSTEAQTINPRDGNPHPISLDPYNTFNTANRDIMMDYCLLNPIKTVEAIFEKLVEDTAGDKQANDAAKSLQLIFKEITQSVINRSIVNSDKITDGIISYIKKVGARYMLSRPTKATGEFGGNLSYAITRYGENLIEGMKNNSLQRNFKLTTVMEVLNSYSLDRLYPHKGESGAFLDPNSFDIDVRDKKHFIDGFSNATQIAYYNSLLKAQKGGESISDALMSVPDLSIGRFAWEGTFRLTFKKETGLDIDMDKIAAKDYDYLEKYKDELEKATTEADRVVAEIANTRNPFVGIAKEGAWRGKMSEILIINNYMTSFTKTENQNGIDAAYAVAYGGKISRIDGIRTIAAILVRSGVYNVVKYKAQLALLAIGYGLLNAIKGGDDSEEKRRRRARGILKYNTVENPEIQGSITGIKDAVTMGNAIQTYDSAWLKKANQYVAPEESASHSFMKGMAQAGAGIILGRSSGGFYNSLVTAPLVEYANEKYIHPAISSDPYNKYRDGIMYSKVYDPNRQDPELNFIVDNSGAFQPFMRASISAVRTFYDRYGSELAKVEKKIEDHERGVSMTREDATKDKYYELVKRRDALKEKEKSMKSMTLKNIIVGVGTSTGILPAGKDIDFVGDKILKDESVPKDWNEIVEKFKDSRNYDEGTMNRRNRNYKDMVLPEVYQQHVSQGYPIPAKKP
jgi:hypothetical protein